MSCEQLNAKNFIVVIDAGHGGHDPGAIGKITREKHINLKVALKLGNLIQQNCKDVKVIYTRKNDVFIPLGQRAEIANNAKADLFISIHTNSLANNHTVKGASTWTLGLHKSQANLEVAKRENSVILYEKDYKTRYTGFNPNSAESYIIFEFMQDKYMEQSVHFASLIQKELKQTCKRLDKGVRQAGFLVLKASAMPSVLVELGFISTPDEEQYLISDRGSSQLAKGIYNAFVTYRNELSRFTEVEVKTHKTTYQVKNKATSSKELRFKIQVLVSSKKLTTNNPLFKGLKDIECYQENKLYKYTYGSSTNYYEIAKLRKKIQPRFKDAFIVAFRGNQKTDIHKAIDEFKAKK